MYVEKLVMRNFRCFEAAEVELNYPGRVPAPDRPVPRIANANLFLGGNGSGKSSVFKALALGVLAPVIGFSGFNAEYLVRRRSEDAASGVENSDSTAEEAADVRAYLRLEESDAAAPPIEHSLIGQAVVVRRGDFEEVVSAARNNPSAWERLFTNEGPAFFLAGYGASRRTARPEGYSENQRRLRYQRVASIFEEYVGLAPFEYAQLQLAEMERLDEARSILNALLPDEVTLTDQTDSQKRLLFDREGVLLPFLALSDGYRAFVGWVWDLLLQLSRAHRSEQPQLPLIEASGVVIVDEIDLFLHPEWQRVVVEQVAAAFPRLQFLFSSHSPLVAGGMEPANLYVLEDGSVEQYRENIYGLTANQVLTSSYFGLRSTRAPHTGTLAAAAARAVGNPVAAASSEEAEPADRGLDPAERARRMLEEVGDEIEGETEPA